MDADTEHKDQILLTETESRRREEVYTEDALDRLLHAVVHDDVHPEAARDMVLMASQARVGDILAGVVVFAADGRRYMISYCHAHRRYHRTEVHATRPDTDE